MFDRLKKLIGGAANKQLEKLETPEVLAEQALQELQQNLKQLKEGFVESITQEKLLEKQIKTNAEQLSTWEKRAMVAVQANNDEIARQCLTKKKEALELDQQLTAQLAQQKVLSADMKQKTAEMEAKFREFQVKKSTLTAQMQSSTAVANSHDLLSKGSTGNGMDKWEEKVRLKEAQAEARSQIAGDHQFKDAFPDSSLDDELAALKQQQQQNQAPKLLEDKSSDS